ncbi:MAG TPA: glycosyltransferase family 2 protein [Actinomycetota bacterium]|nr:glycosyltransferase family 2 protein [Actinomycetota bacterium]
MEALRLIGGLVALGFFVAIARRYVRRDISRLSLIIGFAVTLGVVLLAIAPSAFNPLFESFNFEPGNNGRLIGLLLVASALMFMLVFRQQAIADRNERSIRLLVESLGVERFDWQEAERRRGDGPLLVTVSPAYNEAENVGAVLDAMPEFVEGFKVLPIVVDDRSEDGTAEAARKSGALVAQLPIRRGGGLALRVGYDIALKLDADVVVTLDADGQHLPEELPVLLKPIVDDEADHVNGSRMLGDYERGPILRHVGVHFFSWIVTVLTGQRVTDISSGYRATRADTLRRLILEQDQFWTSEVTIEALRQHARVTEVPVTFLTRRGGESKKPKSLRYGWNFTKAIAKTWLR